MAACALLALLALPKPSSFAVTRRAFVHAGASAVALGAPAARAVSGGGKDFSGATISGGDFSGQSLRGKEYAPGRGRRVRRARSMRGHARR